MRKSMAVRLALGVLGVMALVTTLPVARAEYLSYKGLLYPKLDEAVSTEQGHQPIVYTEDRTPVYVLTRIVVEGTSAQDWTEALEILNTMRRDAPRKVARWYEEFRATGDAHCPSEWTVLAQTSSSVTFERKSPACPPFEAQQALYRVLYGKQQIWTLIATRKVQMDDATRTAWLEVLGTATIED